MRSFIKGVKIDGIASAVPTEWMSLQEQFSDADDNKKNEIKKFIKKTGVTGRFLAGPRQTASDLCYIAADKLLSEKKIDRNNIGVLVFVTQTEDYRSPASAMVIHYRLGLAESCIAFDVNLGCSGFTCGINIASSLLLNSYSDYALLLCGDTSAREKNPAKKEFVSNADSMLFGDSGTATLLVKDNMAPDMKFISATRGSGYNMIITPYEWYRNPVTRGDGVNYMDGVEVFNFSTTDVPIMIKNLMQETENTPDDYDCIVLHQANKMIINRIAKLTGFSDDKTIQSIDKFGNTSSASIPNTLVYNYGSESEGIMHCIMCGYGVGLSWSVVDCYIDKDDILPLIKTDVYFEDDYYVE